MKNKILFVLIGLIMPLLTMAQRISDDEAMDIASQVLGKQVVKAEMKKPAKAPSVNGVQQVEPFYSIYTGEDKQGFVIVSTDRRAPKVIGYGDGKADANNLPPQLKAILEKQDSVLQATPSLHEHSSWRSKAPMRVGEEGGKLLKTANWGQGYPYNLMTPEIDDEHCPTGCVATAMAIAMQYNGWPEKYNWNNIPTDNDESISMELAQLMADAGESVYMNYGPYESGANMNWVGHKLQQDYGYSPDCQYIKREHFNDSLWCQMIDNNIDNDCPVIYSGTDNNTYTGHAFVIDGYNENTYHINWGWNGLYNGYFSIDNIILSESEGMNFTSDAGMVINIKPDYSGKEYSKGFVDYGYFWSTCGLLSGCMVDCDELKVGEPFSFSCYTCSFLPGFVGNVGVALVDKNDMVKEILATQYCTTWHDNENKYALSGLDFTRHNIVITKDIDPSDRLQMVSKTSNDSEWKIMLGTIEAPSYLMVSDIKASLTKVNITLTSADLNGDYYYNVHDRHVLNGIQTVTKTFPKGSQLAFNIFCDKYPDAIIKITMKGKGVYSNEENKTDKGRCDYAFMLYGDSYEVLIELINPTKEISVTVPKDAHLFDYITIGDYNEIASLTVKGEIDATDLWFIRDNLIPLKSLNLEESSIVGCTTEDHKYKQFSTTDVQQPNCLPPFALAELKQLTSLKLPSTLVSTENLSLTGLAINFIEFPSNFQVVGLNTFFDCNDLEVIVCKSSNPPFIPECALSGTKCPDTGILYVPVGSSEAYKNAEVWKDFAQIIEGDNLNVSDSNQTIKGVKYRLKGKTVAIYGYDEKTLPDNLVIPDEIKISGKYYPVSEIEEDAFRNAPFKSCVISNNVVSLGQWAFSSCQAREIVLPNQLKYIPFACFSGCWALEELEIPESVEIIGNGLQNLYNLEKLYIPKKAKREYGSGNFGYGFKSIEIHPDNEDMCVVDGVLFDKGMATLLNFPRNKSGEYEIPESVVKICGNAFERCEDLTSIIFNVNHPLRFESMSINGCNKIEHLEFCDGIMFESSSIYLEGLKSLTLHDGTYVDNTFCYLPNLEIMYLKNNSLINLDRYCAKTIPVVDYYCQSISPAFVVYEYKDIYVPGHSVEAYSGFESNKVHEMWQYRIYRDSNAVSFSNVIDGLEIQSVIINGKEIEAKGTMYYYKPAEGLDVVVNYRLHDRQDMTTHYDTTFNLNIPSSKIGDINGDGQFTISDITFTASYIMGTLGKNNNFYVEAADMDKDGKVLVNDLTAIIDLVLDADNAAYAPARAPQMESGEDLSIFGLSEVQTADNMAAIDVSVKPGYIATQFDVILPEGASLTKASLAGDNAQTHKLTCRKKDGNRVRIIIFSMDNTEMADNLVRLTLQYNGEGEVLLTNALVNEMQSDGRITESAAANTRTKITGNATAIKSTTDSMKIYAEAGAAVIESSKAQTITITNVAGIARKVNVGIGTTRIALPAGVYVVNNVKLLIQ